MKRVLFGLLLVGCSGATGKIPVSSPVVPFVAPDVEEPDVADEEDATDIVPAATPVKK